MNGKQAKDIYGDKIEMIFIFAENNRLTWIQILYGRF